MSERGFSSTIENELDERAVDLALAAYLNWPGGAVRLWSGIGPKSWSSQTWTGAGTLGSVDKIADGLEKTDTGVELTLDYLDDTLRNQVNANDPIGADASIYLWLMNVVTGAVTDGYELFAGYIDRVEIEDDGATGRIIVRLASELARLNQSTFYTLSHAHQQQLFSGDMGMEFAARMDEPILWGRNPVSVTRPVPRRIPSGQPTDSVTTPAPNPRLPDNQNQPPATEPAPRTHPALRP